MCSCVHDFYVDDGITPVPTTCSYEAVILLKKTQSMLYEQGKIRLHKIAYISIYVIKQFLLEYLDKWSNYQSFPSESDGKVRTVEICVVKDGKRATFVTPIKELVLLVD